MHTFGKRGLVVLMVLVGAVGLSLHACKKAPPAQEKTQPEPAKPAVPAAAAPKAEPQVSLPRFEGRDGAEMVEIPAGEFRMGSDDGESDEQPIHRAKLAGFRLDAKPVTNAQFAKFMNDIGGAREVDGHLLVWTFIRGIHRTGNRWEAQQGCGDFPAVGVTWYGASSYAKHYRKRLPTEAEWEYACRAGNAGKWCFGDDAKSLGDHAWYDGNAGADMHAAGGKSPNAWGLYDMHGNVWEWCSDWYDEEYYAESPAKNPKGPSARKFRVLRGGSRLNSAARCRCANRGATDPGDKDGVIGFRCAMSLPAK